MTNSTQRFDLIIFDCDGVLIDSELPGALATQGAMAAAGVELDLETVRSHFSGDGMAEYLRKLREDFGLDAEAVAIDSRDRLYAMFDEEVIPVPGMPELLADLPMPACVASNAVITRLARSLQRLPMAKTFGPHIYSAEHVAHAKPAPDLALHCLEKMGVPAHRAAFVDDNPHGIACAVAAGVHAIGFIERHNLGDAARLKALKAAGANHIAIGAEGLRAWLLGGANTALAAE